MSFKLLTVREVADLLQIGQASVRSLAHQGKIPCIILGPRTIRFDPEALDLWRQQFFQPDVGGLIAVQENGAERPDQLDHDQRKGMGASHGRDRRVRGQSRGQGDRYRQLGKVAQKSAKEIAKILEDFNRKDGWRD